MRISRVLIGLFSCLLLIIIPLWCRCYFEASTHLENGRALISNKQTSAAFDEYRQAISWDAPFIKSSKIAAEESYAAASDLTPEEKLQALWKVRAGIFFTRSLYWDLLTHPFPLMLVKIDQELESLGNPEHKPVLKEMYPASANRIFQLLANIFFWGWILSVVALIFRGFNVQGKIQRSALTYGTSCAIFFVCWLIALSKA